MASIQGIYVALFGRPADPSGLAYFDGITNHGTDLSAIANLAGQPEYLSRFTDLTNTQIINSIYQSLFGRDGEQSGVAFWIDKLASGALSINNIAIAILDGAKGTDKGTADAKIAAADLFTKNLTPAEIAAYKGTTAAAEIKAYLAKVTADHPGSLADIADVAHHLLPTDASSGPTTPPAPALVEFTTGADTFTSTSASTVYTAILGTGETLNSGDSLHGNGNTLNIIDTDTAAKDVLPAGLDLTGIATLSITTAGNVSRNGSPAFDLSGVTGLTKLIVNTSGQSVDSVSATIATAVDITSVSSNVTVQDVGAVTVANNNLSTLALSGSVGNGHGVTIETTHTSLLVTLGLAVLTGGLHLGSHVADMLLYGTGGGTIDAIDGTALQNLTMVNYVALGTDATHLLTLGGSVITISGDQDDADNFFSLSAAGATVTLGGGNNTIALASTATGATVTLGNGNNTIKDNAGGATITVGSGDNVLDLGGHGNDTIYLGLSNPYDPANPTPDLVVSNVTAGDTISFHNSVSGISNNSATNLVDLIHQLYTTYGTAGSTIFSTSFADSNTYVVHTDSGAAGPGDLTIVEVTGIHTITANAGGNMTVQ